MAVTAVKIRLPKQIKIIDLLQFSLTWLFVIVGYWGIPPHKKRSVTAFHKEVRVSLTIQFTHLTKLKKKKKFNFESKSVKVR